jgi:hypothetical protein
LPDGSNPTSRTNFQVCEWEAPTSQIDPRLSHDGTIVFERLEGDSTIHGNYNVYSINADGTNETLPDHRYSQGLANWSHSEAKSFFWLRYRHRVENTAYVMNADGSDNRRNADLFQRSFVTPRSSSG